MPTCRACGHEHATDRLERHVHDELLVVRCPDCGCVMGRYHDPGLRGSGDEATAGSPEASGS
jgi:hypothetical protein